VTMFDFAVLALRPENAESNLCRLDTAQSSGRYTSSRRVCGKAYHWSVL